MAKELENNIHKDCNYYHEPDDLCLCFFELTTMAFNVSKKTKKCLEAVIYNE